MHYGLESSCLAAEGCAYSITLTANKVSIYYLIFYLAAVLVSGRLPIGSRQKKADSVLNCEVEPL